MLFVTTALHTFLTPNEGGRKTPMSFVSFLKLNSQICAGVLETFPSPSREKHISSNRTITIQARGGRLVANTHFKLIVLLDTQGWYFSERDTVTLLDIQTEELIKAHGTSEDQCGCRTNADFCY